jgi:hypothetical protein
MKNRPILDNSVITAGLGILAGGTKTVVIPEAQATAIASAAAGARYARSAAVKFPTRYYRRGHRGPLAD